METGTQWDAQPRFRLEEVGQEVNDGETYYLFGLRIEAQDEIIIDFSVVCVLWMPQSDVQNVSPFIVKKFQFSAHLSLSLNAADTSSKHFPGALHAC